MKTIIFMIALNLINAGFLIGLKYEQSVHAEVAKINETSMNNCTKVYQERIAELELMLSSSENQPIE